MKLSYAELRANRAEWVKALRSDKYKQGRSVLYNPHTDSYCCLGVGAAICPQVRSGIKLNFGYFDDSTELAPPAFMKWVGLHHAKGSYDGNELIRLNDMDRQPFSKIADIIESEPEGLFYTEEEWSALL